MRPLRPGQHSVEVSRDAPRCAEVSRDEPRCADEATAGAFETACTPSFTARSTEPDRFSPEEPSHSLHHPLYTRSENHSPLSPATTCVMKVASHFLWHCAPAVDMAQTCLGRVATRVASRLLQQRAPSDSASRQKAHLLWWTRRGRLADTSQTWRGRGEAAAWEVLLSGTSHSRPASAPPRPPLGVVQRLEQPAREDKVHLRSRQLSGELCRSPVDPAKHASAASRLRLGCLSTSLSSASRLPLGALSSTPFLWVRVRG